MRRTLAVILLSLIAGAALAQVATVVSSAPTYDAGTVRGLTQGTDGSLRVTCS